jgi:pyruvate dehydrogenase E1 component
MRNVNNMNTNNSLTNDIDPIETQEWLDAMGAVIRYEGQERADFLLQQLNIAANPSNIAMGHNINTPYLNTISPEHEEKLPNGDAAVIQRLTAYMRWNAIAMVMKAGQQEAGLGGHLSSYAAIAYLYEVGLHYFFHAPTKEHGGDLVFFQGHSAEGLYSRAFLEGRINEQHLQHFRQEAFTDGLSSYPHPRLMPDFWQFSTVSMGLGPLMAIYQAQFLKYLHHRGLAKTDNRHVWAFCGDGEMGEPESLGALLIAGREKLDNLIFVINCNLQRLDGPVSGNQQIIQELEGVYRGAGWNVIKVIWGSHWDPLFARDHAGILQQRISELVDGEYQCFSGRDGAYLRAHFFGKYPELLALVDDMTDAQLEQLQDGGHDLQKVYAAYAAAVKHQGQPTVILVKTVKGFGLGSEAEGLNIAHNVEKVSEASLLAFRDRFALPISDEDVKTLAFCKPKNDSTDLAWLIQQRKKLGGFLPARYESTEKLSIPDLSIFENQLKGTGERKISTGMVFARLLSVLLRDKAIGARIAPIVADEARTLGLEGLFKQVGIYAPFGQKYTPEDHKQLVYYREDQTGQLLQQGISEPGAMASWVAAATSYANSNTPMIPFYIYYSMFGFQRVGDIVWAGADCKTKGFIIGGLAGRTTLAGEGLQHQDAHNVLMFSYVPNCMTYDPTFSYELAVIVHDGLRRMYGENEDIFYYLTTMNEKYSQPDMPAGVEEGILKGMYLLQPAKSQHKHHAQLLGSGAILREVIAAAVILEKDFSVSTNVWSVTSFNELRKEGLRCEHWNRLNPESPRESYVHHCLQSHEGPVVAATDYMKTFSDQIRAFIPQKTYVTLGTDGYGRSDTRPTLRRFFEVDAASIVIATLKALWDEKKIDLDTLKKAYKTYHIDCQRADPATL